MAYSFLGKEILLKRTVITCVHSVVVLLICKQQQLNDIFYVKSMKIKHTYNPSIEKMSYNIFLD